MIVDFLVGGFLALAVFAGISGGRYVRVLRRSRQTQSRLEDIRIQAEFDRRARKAWRGRVVEFPSEELRESVQRWMPGA